MAITVSATQQNYTFRDLDMTFAQNPITGDLARKYDANAVKQSIRNLISMRPGDAPFHPEISSQVYNLLFELSTPVTVELIRTSIIQVISKFEPRVGQFDVSVVDMTDKNAYAVKVMFVIKGTNQTVTLNTILNRVR